jgi:2-dehydro-3-deoxy-D-arabinonate dehydratase
VVLEVTQSLFRVQLADGRIRLARGRAAVGPKVLLPLDLTLDRLLGEDDGDMWSRVKASDAGPVANGVAILAPVESQPVWAAGVTYERSRRARSEESVDATSVYSRVYDAGRPELFFKAEGWRVVGPDEPIGVRRDSGSNAPEPELVLVLDARMQIVGFSIGNDVSSRSIEGDNPLYLPQAKIYERSCAVGPCIVPATAAALPFAIEMTITRNGTNVFKGNVTTAAMRRGMEDLVAYLGRALQFPHGCLLMTGTGIVPPLSFSLQPGDSAIVCISGLGTLRNPVVAVGVGEADHTAG